MTIQGARDELINMMECKDIPFYFIPILQKVVETIEMEIATISDIEQIRAEIESNMESIIGKYDSSIPKSNMPSYKIERNKVRKECISIIDKYR